MRLVPAGLLALVLALQAAPARAFSEAELIDGFERTVFGSEYPGFGWQSAMVKKFTGPVRFFVDDRSAARRGAEVVRFVRSLSGLIGGLQAGLTDDPQSANFRIFILDRADYRAVVTREIYGRATSSFAPGKCLVRVISSGMGISRADAVIVADEGEFLFKRCMVEEILQGLGPVNDDATLLHSVFNDASPHVSFTAFDRLILNMLYHPSIRAGMTKMEVRRALPPVAAEVRTRIR